MSVAATTAAFALSLPPTQKFVAVALADHADPAGKGMRPSLARLARMTGVNPRTVSRALKDLLEQGVIEVTAPHCQHRATEYAFTLKAMPRGDNLSSLESPEVTSEPVQTRQNGHVRHDIAMSTEPTALRTQDLESRTTTPPTPHGGLTVEGLVDLYNEQAPDNVPAVQTISPKRRQLAAKWLRIYPDRTWWVDVFDAYHRSRFLSGRSKPTPGHESFRPDFDWLLANGKSGVENAVKVHDGAYDD